MTTAADCAGADLRLPPLMDLRSAASLARDLLARRGAPVRLDASAVERLGGLGLQVLLSARLTWRADGIEFIVADPSEAFQADCAALGAPAFGDFKDAHHG
jgi:chemotaxis protein CheX